MSSLKSRYRKMAEGGAVVDDAALTDIWDTGKATTVPDRAAELTQEIADKDPAALQQKIDRLEADIQAGEDEINRSQNERSLAAYTEPTSLRIEREATLQALKDIGLNEGSEDFLRANPTLIDHYDLTYEAGQQAKQQGHKPFTESFNRQVKRIVDAKLNPPTDPISKTLARASGAVRDDFEHAVQGRNSTLVVAPKRYNQAPPSRRVPSSTYEPIEGAVTLTPEQLQACQISGSSPADYARGLIEMRRRKANGDIQ